MSRNAVLLFVVACFILVCAPTGDASPKRKSATLSALRRKLAAAHASSSRDDQRTADIVDMQKTIYSVLGQYGVPEIVSRFRPEFKRLDVDGTLANTLDALYEMRLLDMQISIQHAKKMRSVLDALGHP
jgi:hypothetical protein